MSVQNANSVAITGGTITGITTLTASAVSITGGTIINITDLAVADGGTGASTAAQARINLGVPDAATISITGSDGLTGGGNLAASRTISIAANSNGYGTRYVSSAFPSNATGVDGDIWYQI
jgi:hypothetical protein